MVRATALVIAALLASGCSKDPRLIGEAHEAVRSILKDPDSAQFNDEFAHIYSHLGLVCNGKVNSRNAFGGYTGFQDYWYSQERGAVLDETEAEKALPIITACTNAIEAEARKVVKETGYVPPPSSGR